MASQIGVSFRINKELKEDFEAFCDSVGLSMSTAIILFIKTAVREQRIPFEVTADPFYSPSNMAQLERVTAAIDNGTAHLVEHDLIEE